MKFTLRKNEVTVYVESINELVSFPRNSSEFSQVYNYLMSGDATDKGFLSLFISAADNIIQKYTEGAIEVKESGEATLDGIKLPQSILDKINELRRAGYSWEQHQKFWHRCCLNPRKESVVDLFRFIEHHNLVITEEGKFLGYKAITCDFKDKYTGKIDNHIGKVVTMPREKVTFDPEEACSSGLHVACFDYAKNYMNSGDHLVLVEVDPANVVSVPYDCNSKKIRVCEYKVIREVDPDNPSLKTSVVKVDDTDVETQEGDAVVLVKPGSPWSKVETQLLNSACLKYGNKKIDWENIAELFPGRSVSALQKRWQLINKGTVDIPVPTRRVRKADKELSMSTKPKAPKIPNMTGRGWSDQSARNLLKAYTEWCGTLREFYAYYAKKSGRTQKAVARKLETLRKQLARKLETFSKRPDRSDNGLL